MRPKYHLLASIILGSTIYLLTQNGIFSLSAALSTFFIDLDHLIIYWRSKPKNPFSIKTFLNCKSYVSKLKKIYLFFHAWEWVFVFLALWITFKFSIFLGLATGALLHLILDQIGNSVHIGTYSFIWRLTRSFKTNKVLKKIT